MDLDLLVELTEKLRKESIGDPYWNDSKQAFEYTDQSIDVRG